MKILAQFLCLLFLLALLLLAAQLTAEDPFFDDNDTFSISVFHHKITLDFSESSE